MFGLIKVANLPKYSYPGGLRHKVTKHYYLNTSQLKPKKPPDKAKGQ